MDSLVQSWSSKDSYEVTDRKSSFYNPLQSYLLPRGETKQYMQQFADMYFLRLAKLKPSVESIADSDWGDFQVSFIQDFYMYVPKLIAA